MRVKRLSIILLVSTIAFLAVGVVFTPLANGKEVESAKAAEEEAPSPLFIPMALFQSPYYSIFGVEMLSISEKDGLDEVTKANAAWVRRNGLRWSEIESTQGTYDWAKQDYLMAELRRASESDLEVILIVRSTPTWAQAYPGEFCGRIRTDKLPAFAKFMAETVKKLSAPPFNVKYFEIWNEPDVDRSIAEIRPDAQYGCWGDKNDPYYGGGYYADVLTYVYPAMKAANPSVQVVVGGLLMGCNPTENRNCNDNSEKYLEGILRHHGANDGGNFFDLLNYHSYDYYLGTLGKFGNSNWGSSLSEGPAFLHKLTFLQEVLESLGYEYKEIILTETALLCGTTGQEPVCQNDDYENTKAYYAAQSFALALAKGFRVNIWYAVKTAWRGSSLLEWDLDPQPAYYAYDFAEDALNKSWFKRDLWEYPNIKGLEFDRSAKTTWIMWSTKTDGGGYVLPVDVTLPREPSKVYTVFGDELRNFSGTSLKVTAAPVYVVWDK